MRRLLSVVVGGLLVLSIPFSPAAAVLVSVTYTGDNVIGAWYQNGGSPVAQMLGPNAANWQIADTATLNLAPDDYQLIFKVANAGGPGSGNPAALLAQIQGVGVVGDLRTSTSWEWALVGMTDPPNFDTLTWTAATSYGNNGGMNIWTSVNGGPIGGIDSMAQWIWSSPNGSAGMDQQLYLRSGITVVPEPTALFLLGLGLAGAGAVRLRRRKS